MLEIIYKNRAVKLAISQIENNDEREDIIIKDVLLDAIPYIVNRKVDAVVNQRWLVGIDGTTMDMVDGKISFKTVAAMDVALVSYRLTKIVKELINFTNMLDANANLTGIAILAESSKLINPDELIKKNYKVYLRRLVSSIINMSTHSLSRPIQVADEILNVHVLKYSILETETVDINLIDTSCGLRITLNTDGTLELSVDGISFAIAKVKTKDPIESVITDYLYNLSKDSYSPMGVVIHRLLNECGMLGLFLQPPAALDITPLKFLSGKRIMLRTSGSMIPPNGVYVIIEDELLIGNLSKDNLVVSVSIALNSAEPTSTLRFGTALPFKPVTEEFLTSLSMVLPEDSYVQVMKKLEE